MDHGISIEDLENISTTATYADQRARHSPDTTALLDDSNQITWQEVKSKSDRLASGLLDRVGTEEVIFEQLHNCIELFLLRLACEKAGVRLLTVPPSFREREIKPLFDELQPKLAISLGQAYDTDYVDLIQQLNPGSIESIATLDDSGDISFSDILSHPDFETLNQVRCEPEDVCQLAVTSGSSGIPTCVEVPIGSRMRTALINSRRYSLTESDSIGAITPIISGSPDGIAYHGSPIFGGEVVLINDFAESTWYSWIRNKVNVLLAVPTVTVKLVEYVERQSELTPDLRAIVNYGDKLSPSVGRKAEEMFDCVIHQDFGTVDYGGISSTVPGDSTERRLNTIGKPLEGNEIALATPDGEIKQTLEDAGTLLVRGSHQVGRCIVGENAQIGSYFNVGVRVRLDEQNRLELLEREKDIIIHSGENVYPSEIENLIETHPEVSRATVVGVPDDEVGEKIQAFVVPRDSHSIDPNGVVEYLKEQQLAPFKMPERILIISDLPTVPAGHKVDRAALLDKLSRDK